MLRWSNGRLFRNALRFHRGLRDCLGRSLRGLRDGLNWWPDWARWMADKSGPKIKAPVPGSGKLKVIEDAPGSYVRVKAEA